nr:uncharacterized protein LOC127323665 isoform X2 [Lolium perenne]
MLFRFGLYTSIRGFHGSAWRNFINRNLHAADDGGGRLFLPARLAARRRTSVLHSASRVGDRGFAFAVRLRDATTVKMLKSVLSPEKVKVSAASAHGSLAGGMRRVEEQGIFGCDEEVIPTGAPPCNPPPPPLAELPPYRRSWPESGKGLSSAMARHWLQRRWTWPRREVLPSRLSVADAAIGRSPPLSFNSRIHGLG